MIYSTKYNALDNGADLLCEEKIKSFKIVQARYRKKFHFNISKENSDLQVGTVKIIGQWVPQHLSLITIQIPKRNVHTFILLHTSAFNWKSDISGMDSRASLDIFHSCLRLNSCRCENFIFYLSINITSIMRSFIVLDLCPIILF